MTISYQWLLEYLPNQIELEDLSRILTSVGLEVEGVDRIEAIKGSMEGLVVGEVMTCVPHPNADKLKITTVKIDAGDPVQIVCGAPNVAVGQKVIVAPVGTTIYPTTGEPFTIKKAKIRGEESQGMICAGDEIGLSEDHSGIIVLPSDVAVHTSVKDYYKLPDADHAVHIGLTPNRFDASSHLGVARDLCAFFNHHTGKEHTIKQPEIASVSSSKEEGIKVFVHAPEACPRYMGITLKNIKVGPSPEWMQRRLQAIGVRSINNVVDITNYVLHEYGQPLHAFDADKIKGAEVHVRFNDAGTTFVTLDEKERKLLGSDLMICDKEEGMCMAGVFGGMHSGVTESTTSIFLESAYFEPTHIRRTSMHHGLRTDAAIHFEKGADINILEPALLRAVHLMQELCGATVASKVEDVYSIKSEPLELSFSVAQVNTLSGRKYRPDEITGILKSLGFNIKRESNESLITAAVPSWKNDVSSVSDITEEVMRIDGLENISIPERLNISLLPATKDDRPLKQKVTEQLIGAGFNEILTNSITNSKYYPERNDLVRLMNSLSSELDIMRPSMMETGLEVVAYNINRKQSDLCLFEFGNVYAQGDGYQQAQQLALFITGTIEPKSWNNDGQQSDIFYLKGIVEAIFTHCGLRGITSTVNDDKVNWNFKKKVIATAEAVSAERLKLMDIRQPVCYASFNWDLFSQLASVVKVKYREVGKFPSVERDLALVVNEDVSFEMISNLTGQNKPELLSSFRLFDVFRSDKLGAGKKSMAINYVFQSPDKTLTDKDTEAAMKTLIKNYQEKLGALIRE